ncbi:hypothetical protein V2J56_09290 [Georgenia sp. MJ206]|uniref:hypothetical protein n=1 Tax=Georgenia wangjunii TaxID=3117730 RepID=UPI002F2629C1
MAYATTTLTGTFYRLDGVTPAEGVVRIDPTIEVLRDVDGKAILSGRLTVSLVDGALSVPMPSNDDPGLLEVNGPWQYVVSVSLHHAHIIPVTIDLPAALAAFDLSQTPVTSGVQLVTAEQLEQRLVDVVGPSGRLAPVAGRPGAYIIEGASA